MIIISQDKNNVINFNNVCEIIIQLNGKAGAHIDAFFVNGTCCRLGEFNDFCKAREVLIDISQSRNIYVIPEECSIGQFC